MLYRADKPPAPPQKRTFSDLKYNRHCNSYLQRAYNKHGRQSFYFEILESEISSHEIDGREIYWINTVSENHELYNIATGGANGCRGLAKATIWNGVEYSTMKEAAETVGVSTPTLLKYLRLGCTCDDDIPLPRNFKNTEWNGVAYSSVAQAAKANGCNTNTLYSWLQKGFTCDADIYNKCWRSVIWNSVEYKSVTDAARTNGVSVSAMKRYISSGYVCDADIQHHTDGRSCMWNGIIYETITKAARANHIDRMTMSYRLRQGYACDNDMKFVRKTDLSIEVD